MDPTVGVTVTVTESPASQYRGVTSIVAIVG